MRRPGEIFDVQPTRVRPLGGNRFQRLTFPARVALGRARGSRASERVVLLVHGLGMNEDYFGLLVPELLDRHYDVWALRLPGYVASGESPGVLPRQMGLSLGLYGWVAASALAHLARALEPAPRHVTAWGHSLGALTLVHAVAGSAGPAWRGPDRLVLESPSFGEAVPFGTTTVASFGAAPDHVLDTLARMLLIDDLRSSDYAMASSTPLVPGRTSRAVFTMNVAAMTNPLSRTPRLSPDWLARTSFVAGELDRLVDYEKLAALLDDWKVPHERRLVLPRNHFLSLTSPERIVEWLEKG